jgi:hypothetical protein
MIRDGRQDFVKEIPNRGFHSGSKQLDQELDLEWYIHIEKVNGKIFTIIDPWSGERRKITEKTLEKAIKELKNNVKMCPLLFFLV